jgi:hypothetical protein
VFKARAVVHVFKARTMIHVFKARATIYVFKVRAVIHVFKVRAERQVFKARTVKLFVLSPPLHVSDHAGYNSGQFRYPVLVVMSVDPTFFAQRLCENFPNPSRSANLL